jgi:hypothetical protein
MNKLSRYSYPLVTLIALVAASSAFADDPTVDNTAAALSTKTRAEVMAEGAAARASGATKVWGSQYNPLTVAKSLQSRADVKAEFFANRASAAYFGEDSGSFAMSRQAPKRVLGTTLAQSK